MNAAACWPVAACAAVPLVALAAGAPVLYEARVPTFGCTSRAEVLELQAVRADPMAFGQLLTSQVAYGQCVTIPRGAVVEAAAAAGKEPTLLVNARGDPPGYVVLVSDFRLKSPTAAPADPP